MNELNVSNGHGERKIETMTPDGIALLKRHEGSQMNNAKLCECGCGMPAPIAQKTDKKYGHIKGQPQRFIWNHYQPHIIVPIENRFWDKVDIKGTNDCWEWQASFNENGYGRFSYMSRAERAHRIAFIISGGILTKEKPCVLHTCDNPACVNPAHLIAGSKKDNTQDMMRKHRQNNVYGENHPRAKITDSIVKEIRSLCQYLPVRVVARKLDLPYMTVSYANRGITWKHVSR